MARSSKRAATQKRTIAPLNDRTIGTPQLYSDQLPVLEALRSEADYIIRQAVEESGVKIHEIESRIKTFNSVYRKLSEANANSSNLGLVDVVGLRIICLFRSDLSKITEIIDKEFSVISSDNKIASSDDTFGYMSVHYVCRLNDDVSGRRYDAIKDRVFEIQVRTLCMHAWAAISHYLDYKADWDIPSPLKKDLNALSALFYLADTQYESIFNSREEVRVLSESNEQEKQHTLINFDNLFEYLKNKYPDRQLSRSSVSPLVGELIEAGIDSIESLDADLDARKSQFEAEESDRTDGPYATVGVVRISLRKTHPEYKKVYDQKSRNAVTAAKLRRKSS